MVKDPSSHDNEGGPRGPEGWSCNTAALKRSYQRREGPLMDATGCPGRAELEGFVVGDLPGPEFARIAGHVEWCPDCEDTLQALDHLTDPFVSRLRRSTASGAQDAEPVPRELVAAIRVARSRCEADWLSSGEGPRRLGRFELLERLGAGSFGYVFRAHDTALGRVVAIKIPRAGSPAAAERA